MFLLILSNSKQLTIFFGKSWLLCVSVLLLSVQGVPSCLVVSDSVTPWTGAHQAPLSMGCSRREYWSGLPCPPPGDLLTKESNRGLHCRQILYQLSYQGSPLEYISIKLMTKLCLHNIQSN